MVKYAKFIHNLSKYIKHCVKILLNLSFDIKSWGNFIFFFNFFQNYFWEHVQRSRPKHSFSSSTSCSYSWWSKEPGKVPSRPYSSFHGVFFQCTGRSCFETTFRTHGEEILANNLLYFRWKSNITKIISIGNEWDKYAQCVHSASHWEQFKN